MNNAGTYQNQLEKDLGVSKAGTHKKQSPAVKSGEATTPVFVRKGKEPEVLELPPLNRAERRAQDRRRRLSVKRVKRIEALKASRVR